MTHDPQNAGEATVQKMRDGDFVDGEAAGPYGGTGLEQTTEGRASSTSDPAPVEHAADQGAPDHATTGDDGERSSADGGDGNG